VVSSAPAGDGGGATSGSVAQAKATIGVDGLLFVGAETAKVGDTIKVSITNEETGRVGVVLLDPSGKSVAEAQVEGGATGEVSAVADMPGAWTVRFDEEMAGGNLTKVITVS
jgi:hypothetical protein